VSIRCSAAAISSAASSPAFSATLAPPMPAPSPAIQTLATLLRPQSKLHADPEAQRLRVRLAQHFQLMRGTIYLAFVSFPRWFDARTTIDRIFVEHGVSRQLTVEAQLSQTIVSLVANGAGVALIDPVTAAYAAGRVAVRPFLPEVPDEFYLASAAAQPLSTLASAFVDSARAALQALLG
jgi:hypothetical protein